MSERTDFRRVTCCVYLYCVTGVQVYVVFNVSAQLATYQVFLFQFFTILSYANSAINPFLYAFTNDAFKSAFADAFSCVVSRARTTNPRGGGGGDGGDGGGRRRDVGGGSKCAELQLPDHANRQNYGSVMRLEAVSTAKQTRHHHRILHVDLPPPATSTVDDNHATTCVTVQLEHHHQHQYHQPQQHKPDTPDQ